jgi:hypothetical protein
VILCPPVGIVSGKKVAMVKNKRSASYYTVTLELLRGQNNTRSLTVRAVNSHQAIAQAENLLIKADDGFFRFKSCQKVIQSNGN